MACTSCGMMHYERGQHAEMINFKALLSSHRKRRYAHLEQSTIDLLRYLLRYSLRYRFDIASISHRYSHQKYTAPRADESSDVWRPPSYKRTPRHHYSTSSAAPVPAHIQQSPSLPEAGHLRHDVYSQGALLADTSDLHTPLARLKPESRRAIKDCRYYTATGEYSELHFVFAHNYAKSLERIQRIFERGRSKLWAWHSRRMWSE
jgi:hypothetical protein